MKQRNGRIRRCVDVISGAVLTSVTMITALCTDVKETIWIAIAIFLLWTGYKLFFEDQLILFVSSFFGYQEPKQSQKDNCKKLYSEVIYEVLELKENYKNWGLVESDRFMMYCYCRRWVNVSRFIVGQLMKGETIDTMYVFETIQTYRNDVIYLHELQNTVKEILLCYEKINSIDKLKQVFPYFQEYEIQRFHNECERLTSALQNIMLTSE